MSVFHCRGASFFNFPYWTSLPIYEGKYYRLEQQTRFFPRQKEQVWNYGNSQLIMSEFQNVSQQEPLDSHWKDWVVNATSGKDQTASSVTRPSVIMHTSRVQVDKGQETKAEMKSHIPPIRLKLSRTNEDITSSDELDDDEEETDANLCTVGDNLRKKSHGICPSFYGTQEKDTLESLEKFDFVSAGIDNSSFYFEKEVIPTLPMPQHDYGMVDDAILQEDVNVRGRSGINRDNCDPLESSIRGAFCAGTKPGTVDISVSTHRQSDTQIKELLQDRLRYYLRYFRKHSISDVNDCIKILLRDCQKLLPVSILDLETETTIRSKMSYILQEHNRKACITKDESECKCAYMLSNHLEISKVIDYTDVGIPYLEKTEIRKNKEEFPHQQKFVEELPVGMQPQSVYQHNFDSVTKTTTFAKKYTCEFCSKSFKHEPGYEKHLLTHKGKRTFRCMHCSRSFYHDSSYQRHLKSHTGEKPHQCNYCNMAFCKKSALKVHLRTHTGHQPYSCTYCSKSFSISGNLQRHLHIHTGQRPYKCAKCPKTFNNPSHLARHITSAHVD